MISIKTSGTPMRSSFCCSCPSFNISSNKEFLFKNVENYQSMCIEGYKMGMKSFHK